MIYLKQNGIIFLKPRKVAGTSFEIALSKFAKNEDILTKIDDNDERIRRELGFPGAKNYKKNVSEWNSRDLYNFTKRGLLAEKFYNHISAKEIKNNIGQSKFDSEFKIYIIRNPYDMIISMYFWENRGNERPESLEGWLRKNPSILRANYDQYYIDGACIIDYFVRFENFEEDITKLEELRSLKGLWCTFKEINAKGGIRPKSATLSDTLQRNHDIVDVIRFFNKELIERFEYSI